MKKFLTVSLFILGIPGMAQGALLYSAAGNQDVYEGQTFVVDWFLDTTGESINVLDLKLEFSSENLKVVDASTGNSLISLWIKTPSVNNESGLIELSGGAPNGLKGERIPIFRTVFEALKPGSAFINLEPSSVILKNDGSGSGGLLQFRNESFNIYPKDLMPVQITSKTHPNQNQWYVDQDVKIAVLRKSATDYSYSFSSNLEMIPDDQIDQISDELEFADLPDGIYYFKLNSKVGPSNWQEAGVYRIQIDSSPPQDFTPEVGSDPNIYNGKKFVSFSTVDKISGMSHYNIKFGLLGFWQEAASPYELHKPIIGNKIQIAAYDDAGNKIIEILEFEGMIPEWLFVILIVGLMAGAGYLVRKKFYKNKE